MLTEGECVMALVPHGARRRRLVLSKDPLLYVGLIRGGRMSDQSQHVGKGALASEPFGVALVDGEACLGVSASPRLVDWLESSTRASVFTTYQAGRLFFLGFNDQGRLSLFERHFDRCMGLCAQDDTLSTRTPIAKSGGFTMGRSRDKDTMAMTAFMYPASPTPRGTSTLTISRWTGTDAYLRQHVV